MKAVVLTRFGPPDVLRLQDVDEPSPEDDEVLLKVHATAVNDWDWQFMNGRPFALRLLYGVFTPKVDILGAEVSGRVEAVGAKAIKFHVGDEVYGDISESGFGGFAEYVCVREDALTRKPAEMTFEQATSLPHASALAMQGLIDRGQIHEGAKVLINGAGGGVGTLGVQIAKTFGAETTGVDSGAKLGMMRSVGFDHIIDYEREDFTDNGQQYDLILDTKTTRSPFRYLRSLRRDGIYVTVGGHLPRLLQAVILGPLIALLTNKKIRVVALEPNKDMNRINELFRAGKLECVLDGPFALRDVPEAIQLFGDGRHMGKVVISVPGS